MTPPRASVYNRPTMQGPLVEVKTGVLSTFEDEQLEVQGGAYLSPEAFLTTEAELTRLRAEKENLEKFSLVVPSLVVAAGLVGAAFGYWFARRSDD